MMISVKLNIHLKSISILVCAIAVLFIFAAPVALGVTSDYDLNGYDDFLLLYDYNFFNTGALALASDGSAVVPKVTWSSGPGNWDWTRSKVASGDFDNDDRADLFVLYDYGNANTGAFVFKSNGTGMTSSRVWLSGAGNWDWNRVKITAGDYDNDGRDDILAFYDYGNYATNIIAFKSDGAVFTPVILWQSGLGNWDNGRAKIDCDDFDNDGRDDVFALYDYGNADTAAWVFKSNGTGLTPSLAWSSGPGNWEWARSKMVAGDFNNDNLGDAAVVYDYGGANTGIFMFRSDATKLYPTRGWLSGPGNFDAERVKITAGKYSATAGDQIGLLYDYGYANTAAWVLSYSSPSFSPALFWSSGPGSFEFVRTRIAGSNTFIPRFIGFGGKWIDINLSAQLLVCYQVAISEPSEGYFISWPMGVFSTLVSSGRPPFNTPTGNFAVYEKDPVVDMSGFGGTSEYYYVPNVPYVLWFTGNYSIHGAYWHNDFGNVRSHGCVNIPVPAAAWIYGWAPIGTPVIVHY